jgi:putative addiction module killer protein
MIEIRKTQRFVQWIDGLKDLSGRARIQARLERLAQGHKGDCKAVGAGVLELRFQFGPGYRVYFTQQGDSLIFLLVGGDKSTQSKDIEAAITLAENL